MHHQRSFRAVALAAAMCFFLPANVSAQDEDEERLPRPGLIAQYRNASTGKLLFERLDATANLLLAADESPDSRLAPGAWLARWQALLDVQQPGKYRFSASATGRLTVELDGRVVLSRAASGPADVTGDELELTIGLHPISISFQPAQGPTSLKLSWQSTAFLLEPIPARAFVQHPETNLPVDRYTAGRLTVEEHSCVACHAPDKEAPLSLELAQRKGPVLASAGSRLRTAWIYDWLGDPQAYRAEAVMPKLFGADRQGEIERFAVALLLASLGAPLMNEPPSTTAKLDEGKQLYERTGCIVCHEKQELPDNRESPPRATLAHLSQKSTTAALAAFIEEPYRIDPSGRMPKFGLDAAQCQNIAAYLAARDLDKTAVAALPAPPTDDELAVALGKYPSDATGDPSLERLAKRVVEAKRCAACHDFGESLNDDLKSRPVAASFAALAEKPAGGCLATGASPDTSVPRFGAALDRESAVEFLGATKLPAAKSPPETLRLAIARFNCTACHERNGDGGLSLTLMRHLTENQTSGEAELVRPPTLTGIAEKLLPRAVDDVLLRGARSRPWMALKMPQFPADQVAALPSCFAAADGDMPAANIDETYASELVEAGRELVGAKGFGCIKCHDLGAYASTGTRGPDLAKVKDRVALAWYDRWMTDPQRLEPGTRMPTVFFGGQSPYKQVLDGDPAAQRRAIWAYLSGGDKLVPPEGVDEGRGRQGIAGGEPLVMRTFLPGLSPRSLAIRLPSGLHLGYDAQACRLGFAWRGDFLDMGPVWTGRGGRPAGIEGSQVWTAPDGFPWEITRGVSTKPPDFANRAANTELGATPPDDGQLHPSRLKFGGYRLTPTGPVFSYEYRLEGGRVARFEEAPGTQLGPGCERVVRRFKISAPPSSGVWFLASTSDREPVAYDPTGQSRAVAAGGLAGANNALVVVRSGAAQIVQLEQHPESAQWVVEKQGESWLLLLTFAAESAASEAVIVVTLPTDGSPAAVEPLIRRASATGGAR